MTGEETGGLKVKTAAIATTANVLLTATKFALYFFSGSMAILAEAWHSFTDIATSILVLIAVITSSRRGPDDKRASIFELITSLMIGLLLLSVSINLGWRCFTSQPTEIENALIAGLIFIAFSVGSYLVSVFELKVGHREASPGLIADGMHARADMMASLLTGISLIIYHMGANIDRFAAGLIVILIFAFAVETIVNAVLAYRRRNEDQLFNYRSFKFVTFLFDREQLQACKDALGGWFRIILPEGVGRKLAKGCGYLLLVLIIGGYLSTAIFTVNAQQRAIVERLGRPVNMQAPLNPGLHIKLPWPFDMVQKVDVTTIRTLNIGNTGDAEAAALLWTKDHGTEYAFISGDDNFFYPYIILHYRISSLADYLYGHNDSVELSNQLAHRLTTNSFAKVSFDDITVNRRAELEQDLHSSLQAELDRLKSGIEIVSVNFKDIHPPILVAGSFEKVIAGYQEKQKLINDAVGYRNEVLPRARGKAAKELASSQAYIIDRSKRSQGDARRFILSQPATATQRQAAMSNKYYQVMQETLSNKVLIVLDPKVSGTEVWLDFQGIISK